MPGTHLIRIANAQGFWGDSLEAPLEQIRRGPIDYLTLDYLAEVTMSILQKQRSRNPSAGYARDFIDMLQRGAREIIDREIKVVANAGGVNPEACCGAAAEVFKSAGLGTRVKIAAVIGDDILPRLDALLDQGIAMQNLDTGEPISSIRSRIQSANVYLGALPIAEALAKGAQIVVTGRCADAALSLGPTIHEFGWSMLDWNKLAAGMVAGHVIECGAQCTGGNCQSDWESIPDFANIGYPIIEAEPDGSFVITKHADTGGRVSAPGIIEQLLYEIGDPHSYVTPDVVVDFTSIQLAQAGPDRVRFWQIKGRPPTDSYKVSISYSAGYKAVGSLVYGWPDAYKKAKAADQIFRTRLDRLGLEFESVHTEFVGANALHGESLSGEPRAELPEVMFRVGVRGQDKASVERFTRELAPLALNGPPVVTYLTGGRPKVEEMVAYWPALVPKSMVKPEIRLWEI